MKRVFLVALLLLTSKFVYASNNVLDYGATPNDGLDDTAAFNQAIANADGVVYVPAGEFNLSSRLDLTGAVVSVQGEGIGISKLVWDSGVSGIYVKPPSGGHKTALLQGLTLYTKSSDGGDAYQYDGVNTIKNGNIQPRTRPKVIIRDVEMSGYTGAANSGWNRGLIIDSSLGTHIDGFYFSGQVQNSTATPLSDKGILLRGTGNPVEITITEAAIYYADVAIEASNHEGLFVSDSNLVFINYGVKFTNSSAEPQFNLSNSHFNCIKGCVWLDKVVQVSIKDNLFYGHHKAGAAAFGVQLFANSDHYNISNNTFINTSQNYDFNGVVVRSDEGIISGNVFSLNNKGAGVWFMSTASYGQAFNNICKNCATKGLNQGGGTNAISWLY